MFLAMLTSVAFFTAMFSTFSFVAAVVGFHGRIILASQGKAPSQTFSAMEWFFPSLSWTVFYILRT